MASLTERVDRLESLFKIQLGIDPLPMLEGEAEAEAIEEAKEAVAEAKDELKEAKDELKETKAEAVAASKTEDGTVRKPDPVEARKADRKAEDDAVAYGKPEAVADRKRQADRKAVADKKREDDKTRESDKKSEAVASKRSFGSK